MEKIRRIFETDSAADEKFAAAGSAAGHGARSLFHAGAVRRRGAAFSSRRLFPVLRGFGGHSDLFQPQPAAVFRPRSADCLLPDKLPQICPRHYL